MPRILSLSILVELQVNVPVLLATGILSLTSAMK